MQDIKGATQVEQTLGFIGAGNMVSAILSGVLARGLARPEAVWLSNRSAEKLSPWGERGVHVTQDNVIVAQNAQVIVLGIKPQVFPAVLPQIAPHVQGKCVVSLAPGYSVSYLRGQLPGALVMRVMPNTPMKLGKGATVVAQAPDVPEELFRFVHSLFASAGAVAVIPEEQMDDFIPVSGSSPAFFFRMAAAMVDAAKAAGIDPDLALTMTAQTMAGSAAMLLETGQTAQELTRQVCSPGGTTLAALTAFDDYRFEEMMAQAAARCAQRSRELGK